MLTLQRSSIRSRSPYAYSGSLTNTFSSFGTTLEDEYLRAYVHLIQTNTTETQAQKFQTLMNDWKTSTQVSSSMYTLLTNPSYLKIISMGESALPFIFEDLSREESHWFPALNIITGANPVPAEQRGNIAAMTEAWLSWGKERGYVT